MALDVYVMPLWKFKAGDFTSPLEATLGVKPIIVTPRNRPPDPLEGMAWYWRLLAKLKIVEIGYRDPDPSALTWEKDQAQSRARALREVATLKEELTPLSGTPVDWPDEGGVEFREQFRDPVRIRAFAAWLNYRDAMPEFTAPPESKKSNYYYHPAMLLAYKEPPPRFATLIKYDAWSGYLFPAPFEGVHGVEPFTQWGREFERPVASSHTILRELEEMLPYFDEVPAKVDENGQNPVADAHWRAQLFHKICKISVEHQLPVIFHG